MFTIKLSDQVLTLVSSTFFDIPNPFTIETIFNGKGIKFCNKNNYYIACYHSSSQFFNSVKSVRTDLSITSKNICFLLTSLGGFPELALNLNEVRALSMLNDTQIRLLLALSTVAAKKKTHNPIHSLLRLVTDYHLSFFEPLSPHQLALMHDVPTEYVHRWCSTGQINATRKGMDWRVDLDTALNFIPPKIGRPPKNT